MKKNNIIKIGGMLVFIGSGVYQYFSTTADADLNASLVSAMVAAPDKATLAEPTTTAVLPFKVAPDANDMFEAAKLLANTLNPELEKKWLGIRLHTRLSREYEAQAAANLNVQKNTLKSLELSAKISAINEGKTIAAVATETADNNPLYRELADISVVLMSYTADQGKGFVSLKIGDTTYERVRTGHRVGAFEVVALRDADRCVVLKYKSQLLQNRCV